MSDGCMAVSEQEVVDHLRRHHWHSSRGGAHLIRSSLDRQLLCLVPLLPRFCQPANLFAPLLFFYQKQAEHIILLENIVEGKSGNY